MAKIRVVRFTVEGTGSFPFDMLRYDQAWPVDTDAAIALDHENWRNSRPRSTESYSVCLVTHGDVTPERWQSFGWRVTSQEVRTY